MELLVFAAIKIIMMKNPIIGISVSKKCVRFLLTGGNDARGRYLKKHIGLAHSRLAIRDILCGNQPMTRSCDGRSCTIVYNGEIYNTDEIIPELNKNGYVLSTTSDTEVILYAYMHYGADFVECYCHMGRCPAEAVSIPRPVGVKPLFYATPNDTLIFGSEPKACFVHP